MTTSFSEKAKKGGFSLMEILLSVTILTLVSLGIFSLYNFLLNNTREIEANLESQYYTRYIFDIVSNIDPLKTIDGISINRPFYIIFQDNMSSDSHNQLISYTFDPNYKSRNVGFNLYGSGFHEISLIGTGGNNQIEFSTYKIYTKTSSNESTIFLTK